MLRRCLNYFKWGLLATVLVGLAVWLYIGRHLDDELRRRVEARLAAVLPNLSVSVDSARLVEGEGIHLRGIRIRHPKLPSWQAELVAIDEITLGCDTCLKKLIQQDVCIRRVVVRRPRLSASRLHDGTWSIDPLLKLRPVPLDYGIEVAIEGGTLEIVDAGKPTPSRYTFRDINVKAASTIEDGEEVFRLQAKLLGDHLREVEFRGTLRFPSMLLDLTGDAKDLDLSPSLLSSLPQEVSGRLGILTPLHARADVGFQVAYNPRRSDAWHYDTTSTLKDGRIEHPSLPYALRELQATVRANRRGLEVQDLTARNRQTTLRVSARKEGWGPGSRFTLWIEGRQVVFDQRLLHALPRQWRAVWKEYSPEGEADVDATLVLDGGQWRPTIKLTARDVAFAYYKYPYRLNQTTGTLSLAGDALDFDFTAHARGVPVRLRGDLRNLGPRFVGWIDVRGQRLPMERDLIDALPPKGRRVVQSFHPSGTFDAHLRLSRQTPAAALQETLRLRLHDCFVRYRGFPYPLSKVSGWIEHRDGIWTFKDLTAFNGSGRVTCNGTLEPTPAGRLLTLDFTGQKIALDDELLRALQPMARRAWASLRPQGFVNLAMKLRQRASDLQLTLDIHPLDDSVRIEPVDFPYRLEKLRGHIRYDNGVVDLNGLRAEHGDTRWRAAGKCQHRPDGSWTLRFTDLGIDLLRVDRDLLRAVPADLRQFLAGLNPTGPFNLRGVIEFARGGLRGDPLTTAWDLDLICHRNSIHPGVKLDDIFGNVRINGQYRGSQLRCTGRLNLDAVTYRGFQFTELRGPFEVRDDRVLFGTPLSRTLQPGPRHITARAYGGVVYGDAWVRRGSPHVFSLRANLREGDLGRFSREAVVGRRTFSGRADAGIKLNGTSQGVHSLQGEGGVQLRDANIYELPVMLALLKVLTLEQPDLTAFDTSDISFKIQGNHVYFDRIDFKGHALTLYGNGTMNFDRELRLTFTSELGSSKVRVPIISDLVGGTGGQLVGEVYVGGTLDEPDVRREPFPVLKEAIENLQRMPPFLPPGAQPMPRSPRSGGLSPMR